MSETINEKAIRYTETTGNDNYQKGILPQELVFESFIAGAEWMQSRHDWIPISELPQEANHRHMLLKGKRGGFRLIKNFPENYARYLAKFSDHVTHFKYVEL